jgi:hypothetical protein
MDVDICGPSVPTIMGVAGEPVHQSASGLSPVYVDDNLAVMSVGFLLPEQDEAVIWRGPKKNGAWRLTVHGSHAQPNAPVCVCAYVCECVCVSMSISMPVCSHV